MSGPPVITIMTVGEGLDAAYFSTQALRSLARLTDSRQRMAGMAWHGFGVPVRFANGSISPLYDRARMSASQGRCQARA